MRALVILALGLAAACGDGTTTPANGLGGPFTLRLYNGENLPAHIDEAFGFCGPTVVAGSVTSTGDGRVTFSRSSTDPCTAGAPVTVVTFSGTVAVDGATVTITLDDDFPGGNRIYQGALVNDQLTLNHEIDYGNRRLNQYYAFVRA